MGRPTKYTDEYLAELVAKLEDYTEQTEIPILAEFASRVGIPRQKLYEFDAFYDAIKGAIDKKEAALERLALEGKVNVTMAIFSLKQLGWSDKLEQKDTSDKPNWIIEGIGDDQAT